MTCTRTDGEKFAKYARFCRDHTKPSWKTFPCAIGSAEQLRRHDPDATVQSILPAHLRRPSVAPNVTIHHVQRDPDPVNLHADAASQMRHLPIVNGATSPVHLLHCLDSIASTQPPCSHHARVLCTWLRWCASPYTVVRSQLQMLLVGTRRDTAGQFRPHVRPCLDRPHRGTRAVVFPTRRLSHPLSPVRVPDTTVGLDDAATCVLAHLPVLCDCAATRGVCFSQMSVYPVRARRRRPCVRLHLETFRLSARAVAHGDGRGRHRKWTHCRTLCTTR